jgi:6-phosphogluconolactonase (cycloisomerase 2 family)
MPAAGCIVRNGVRTRGLSEGIAVAVAALAVLAAVALAGPNSGKLLFLEAEDGIEGANDLAVSNDGRNLYAVAYDSGEVVTFKRSRRTGRLNFVENDAPADAVEAGDVAISPDGRFVYVTEAEGDGSILIFARKGKKGRLALVDRREHNDPAILSDVFGLGMSRDGKHLYATTSFDARLITYRRSRSTGKLSLIAQRTDDELTDLGSPVVSPDGRNVYVPAATGSALVTYKRNRNTGRLTFLDAAIDGEGGVDGIASTYGLAVSPDGRFVYATGSNDSGVAAFKRRPAGTLRFLEARFDDEGPIESMSEPYDVVVSRDGRTVYVAGYGEDAVVVFRVKADGTLRFLHERTSGIDTATTGPYRMGRSRDGKSLYTADYDDDVVAVFDVRR